MTEETAAYVEPKVLIQVFNDYFTINKSTVRYNTTTYKSFLTDIQGNSFQKYLHLFPTELFNNNYITFQLIFNDNRPTASYSFFANFDNKSSDLNDIDNLQLEADVLPVFYPDLDLSIDPIKNEFHRLSEYNKTKQNQNFKKHSSIANNINTQTENSCARDYDDVDDDGALQFLTEQEKGGMFIPSFNRVDFISDWKSKQKEDLEDPLQGVDKPRTKPPRVANKKMVRTIRYEHDREYVKKKLYVVLNIYEVDNMDIYEGLLRIGEEEGTAIGGSEKQFGIGNSPAMESYIAQFKGHLTDVCRYRLVTDASVILQQQQLQNSQIPQQFNPQQIINPQDPTQLAALQAQQFLMQQQQRPPPAVSLAQLQQLARNQQQAPRPRPQPHIFQSSQQQILHLQQLLLSIQTQQQIQIQRDPSLALNVAVAQHFQYQLNQIQGQIQMVMLQEQQQIQMRQALGQQGIGGAQVGGQQGMSLAAGQQGLQWQQQMRDITLRANMTQQHQQQQQFQQQLLQQQQQQQQGQGGTG